MWYNGIIAWILKSPFHSLLSKNTLLMEYTGRRSGKRFETPLNYARTGDELTITSQRQRTWWRNFIGGAPVRLRLAGEQVNARAIAQVDPDEVAQSLEKYLTAAPQIARYFQVSLDEQGHPKAVEVQLAAQSRVTVRILFNSNQDG